MSTTVIFLIAMVVCVLMGMLFQKILHEEREKKTYRSNRKPKPRTEWSQYAIGYVEPVFVCKCGWSGTANEQDALGSVCGCCPNCGNEDLKEAAAEMTAIEILKRAKRIHKGWADFFEKNPDKQALYEHAGDLDHHKKWVENYDKVIAYIEQLHAENKKLTKRLMEHGEALMVLEHLRQIYKLDPGLKEPQAKSAVELLIKQSEEGLRCAHARRQEEYIAKLQKQLSEAKQEGDVMWEGLNNQVAQFQKENEEIRNQWHIDLNDKVALQKQVAELQAGAVDKLTENASKVTGSDEKPKEGEAKVMLVKVQRPSNCPLREDGAGAGHVCSLVSFVICDDNATGTFGFPECCPLSAGKVAIYKPKNYKDAPGLPGRLQTKRLQG